MLGLHAYKHNWAKVWVGMLLSVHTHAQIGQPFARVLLMESSRTMRCPYAHLVQCVGSLSNLMLEGWHFATQGATDGKLEQNSV